MACSWSGVSNQDDEEGGPRPLARSRRAADAADLEPVPVVARDPLQPEPGAERFLEVLGGDRADGADVLVVAEAVRRPTFAVEADAATCAICEWTYRRRGRCAALRAPPPGPPHGTGRSPGSCPACCATRSGCSGLPLEELKAGVEGLPDRGVNLGDQTDQYS
jgi:hypothetical protein